MEKRRYDQKIARKMRNSAIYVLSGTFSALIACFPKYPAKSFDSVEG